MLALNISHKNTAFFNKRIDLNNLLQNYDSFCDS